MRALLASMLLFTAPVAPQRLSVPTTLAITRTATALSVSIADPREQVTVDVTPGLILGVSSQLVVDAVGTARPRLGREGLSSGTDFNLGTSIFNRAQDGLPVPGVPYVVQMTLTVFETDRPPEHLWSPQGPKYRVLWTGVIQQRVD
jgi:hypothetical protein